MHQTQIISSSCRTTFFTKHTRKTTLHKFSFKLTLIISLVLLSTLIEAVPTSSVFKKRDVSPDDLQRFVNFASAAYCDSSTFPGWNCGPNCDATKGTVVTEFFTTPVTDTQAFIATYAREGLIIVSFRGTESGDIRSIATDADIILRDYPPVKNARVHSGFYRAFLEAQFKVFNGVKRLHAKHPNFKVFYTGHSLGGALTLLAALDLVQNSTDFVTNKNLFVVTYGQPRVGDPNFAKYVDSKLKLSRVVNGGDIVPHLPPIFFDYQHANGELWISNKKNSSQFITCNGDEDPNCSDSLPGYDVSSFHDGPYFGIEIGCNANKNYSQLYTALRSGYFELPDDEL